MNQGDIWLVNLDPIVHSETGKTRPGLIISVDAMNHHSPRIIIAPITSSVGRIYPFEALVAPGTSGLAKDSKIMLDQIRSIDKKRLVRKVGVLEPNLLQRACTIVCKLIKSDYSA
jgi:mRNA interferase MazF